jgi:pimeloyl-ACP methyl ester carboxylesterase
MLAAATTAGDRLEEAERRLFAHYDLDVASRFVALTDPPLRVRVLEAGDGDPVLLVHGSGMAAATWAPMLAQLRGRRAIAVDLPGFGLSDALDYSGRPLREHAVAQLTSLLNALELARAPIVGTSLGAMWALCMALDRPERVSAVAALGVPAVALPGTRGDPFFTAMTTPVVRSLVSRMPAPPSAGVVRKTMRTPLGADAVARLPQPFFEVVHQIMRRPGWKRAMRTHLALAFKAGRLRPENPLTDDELRRIEAPVLFILGTSDVYGPTSIGERAVSVMPHARLVAFAGAGHAPFMDDPARCASLIEELLS